MTDYLAHAIEHPDRPVLIVSHPDIIPDAAALLPGYAVVSHPADDFLTVPWRSLEGRRIDLWPTATAEARDTAARLGNLFTHFEGCTVRLVDVPEDSGWTLTQARADGWDTARTIEYARDRLMPWPPPEGILKEFVEPTQVQRQKPQAASTFVSWQELGLACTEKGQPHPHIANAVRILCGHPDLVGKIWFDEFHDRIFSTLFSEQPREWSDTDDTRLTAWMQETLGLHKMSFQTVQRAVESICQYAANTRNEPKEWMESLVWDGLPRLDTFIADVFTTPKDHYHAAVGRCFMVSMVARIYEPGCKVDTMPVFEGVQGLKKSTALSILGGKWFSEMHEDITTKDFLQNLPGKMLIEISELHAFRRADIDRIKGIISCASDRYRASYGRRAGDHPRRGVWVGTTNHDDWVTDKTGARRFWPVLCKAINLDYLRANREQLFAEAVATYKRSPIGSHPGVRERDGSDWWTIDETAAKVHQDERRDNDPWFDAIANFCAFRAEVTVEDIFEVVLMLPLQKREMASLHRVGGILRMLGYKRANVRRGAAVVKVWKNLTMENARATNAPASH